MRPAALAALLALLCAACSGSSTRRPGQPERNDAIIQLECPIADAEVYVNGKYAALVREFRGGMALAPGVHRIVIRHADYHEHYVRLEVGAREKKTLKVHLAERLP